MQLKRKVIAGAAYQQLMAHSGVRPVPLPATVAPQYFINYNNNGCVINHLHGPIYQLPVTTATPAPEKIPATYASQPIPAAIGKRKSCSVTAPRKTTYTPYTLKDYDNIKPQKYYQLGGLGANIGSPEWLEKKRRLDRMHEFARSAQLVNRIYFESSTHTAGLGKRSGGEDPALRMRRKMQDYSQALTRQRRYANWRGQVCSASFGT